MSDDYNPYKSPESDLSKPDTTIPEGEKYTPLMVEHLKNTRPWVFFIAVMFIIFAAFMVLAGLGMLITGSYLPTTGAPVSFSFIGIVYILMTGIYIPMIVFLFRYANSIKGLLDTGKTESIEKALGDQKSYWKYTGILLIIMICLGVIGIIAAIAVGIMGASRLL